MINNKIQNQGTTLPYSTQANYISLTNHKISKKESKKLQGNSRYDIKTNPSKKHPTRTTKCLNGISMRLHPGI